MNKTILRSLLFALAGACAMNLRAEVAWTTGEGAPGDWSPLSNNLLLNQTGTTTGTISFLTPVAQNITRITDGVVPTSRRYAEMLGFAKDATVEWNFGAPRTLERIRITTCDITDGRQYDDIAIADVLVKYAASGDWVSLGCGSINWKGTDGAGIMLYVTLEDSVSGRIAEGVMGLRVKFGQHNNVAQYYSEIEAVGFAEATGPVIGSFDIAPTKTKATVSGSIADPGTDATACDVYLALDGGAATKIATGVTGAFSCTLKGLTAGTEYAYELSVSNNAPTAKGTVRNGTFTMLAADAQTASWTQKDVAPGDWTALSGNILSGNQGSLKSGAIAGTNYATDDSGVLTDGTVPTTGGAAYIYGFQNNAVMEWTLDKAMTLERLRISACYLAGSAYTRLAVGSVSVKLAGSDAWTALDAPAFSDIAGKSQNVILLATLSDCETGVLSENVVGLRIVFGNVNALGSYCAEIEAVGQAETKKGKMVIFVN